MKKQASIAILFFFVSLILSGCFSAPKQTIELAEITDEQIAELQKSHIRFVQLYYDKLREDINDFIDNKWTPTFLSKAVQNEQFRESLDDAYATSTIDPADLSISWKGQPLPEPQNRAVLSGVKTAITDEQAKLGAVLLGFSKAALKEINARRTSLLASVDDQEQMVIDEINGAFADLQRSQAAIKGYLASAVNLKAQQDLALKKLGVLEKSQNLTNAVLEKADKLSGLLQSGEDANKILNQVTEEANQKIQNIGNTVHEIMEE